MMKKSVFLTAALIISVLLLSSCAISSVTQTTGSLSLLFPMGSLSKDVGDPTYLVRVFYGLDLYDKEPDIVGDEITFPELPLGEAWIFIARGVESTDGFFYPTASGDLEITIVPGENGPVSVTLEDSPFQWSSDLKGKNVVGLVAVGDNVYAATSQNLYKGTYTNGVFSTSDGPDVPAGVTVNSLSQGTWYDSGTGYEDQVWVNSTWTQSAGGGIMAWTVPNGSLDNDFSDGFGNTANRKDGVVTNVNIVNSGAFKVDTTDEEGVAIFFQRDGGLGGLFLDISPNEFDNAKGSWPWIVDDINLGDMLGDVVEDTDDLIQDLEIGSTAAYLVSTLISVKVSEEILTSETTITSDDLLDSDLVAYAPEVGAPITDLDLDEAKGKIYIGTGRGLYVGDISSVPGEFIKDNAAPTAVAGTTGYAIKGVVSSTAGNYVAFITKRGDDPDLLSFIRVSDSKVVTYRTLQGLPGESIQSLAWLSDGSIAIAGDRGLVAVAMSSVFPQAAQ
jgi:hypothetical protein